MARHKPGQHQSVQDAVQHRGAGVQHPSLQQAISSRLMPNGSWSDTGKYPSTSRDALPTPAINPINPF